LALLESYRKNLTSQPTFLVQLTRSVKEFRLYTDDKDLLLAAIIKNAGIKRSALEVIGEFPKEPLVPSTHAKSDPLLPEVDAVGQTVAREPEARQARKDLALSTQTLKSPIKPSAPYFDKETITRIKEGLNQAAASIAIEILGQPKERGNTHFKFGSHQGSLSVTIKGDKQGLWYDFATGQGGNMLKLIEVHGGMGRQAALAFGARYLGLSSQPLGVTPKQVVKPSKTVLTPVGFSDYEKRQIVKARRLAQQSRPITGTLAERYLKEHRGIALDKIPDDIRFHSGVISKLNHQTLPALLAIARDNDGAIQSVEAVYLDAKTGGKAQVKVGKQTFGPKKGAAVMIKQAVNPDAPSLIAEGVVTGLSLAKALPEANVVITLGKQSFGNIDPAVLSSKVIFCLDNDGQDLKKDKLIQESAKRLQDQKKEVQFMVPQGLALAKQDYNDILKQKGVAAVRQDFEGAISYADFYKVDGKLQPKQTTPLPNSSVIHQVLKGDKDVIHLAKNTLGASANTVSDKVVGQFARQLNQTPQLRSQGLSQKSVNQVSMTKPIPTIQTIKQPIKDIDREI
jgi:hypothetical protein